MIQLVIIDFDDTLSLTEAAFFELENIIATKLGCPPMTRAAHQANWGKPLKEAITERIPGINPDEFIKMNNELLPDFVSSGKVDTISAENIETLKKLKKDGKYLAILTSRTHNELIHILDKNHHLNKWIDKIYHADNSKYLKPNPKVFNQILENFHVKPQEAVYVGDSLGDGISAKGAGVHFIALMENGLKSKEDFKSIPVDYFAQKFPDIIKYTASH